MYISVFSVYCRYRSLHTILCVYLVAHVVCYSLAIMQSHVAGRQQGHSSDWPSIDLSSHINDLFIVIVIVPLDVATVGRCARLGEGYPEASQPHEQIVSRERCRGNPFLELDRRGSGIHQRRAWVRASTTVFVLFFSVGSIHRVHRVTRFCQSACTRAF